MALDGTVNVGVQPTGVESQRLAIKKYGETAVQHSDLSLIHI